MDDFENELDRDRPPGTVNCGMACITPCIIPEANLFFAVGLDWLLLTESVRLLFGRDEGFENLFLNGVGGSSEPSSNDFLNLSGFFLFQFGPMEDTFQSLRCNIHRTCRFFIS